MFYHGWNAYYEHAFPADELQPLTCDGLSRDFGDPTNIGRNDVLGNYSLTLIDSLDMFAILGDQPAFEHYVDVVRDAVSFNVSSTVQVFETTIRGMGGLLSAHLYAAVPKLGSAIRDYDGHLLALAYDLGQRLLPAFDTPNGIPAPRVNLQTGLMLNDDQIQQITETCTSGAGSLLLEFGLLSRLTGDDRFENVARKAFFALYMRRSDLDLVAMSIDSQSAAWQAPLTGNGASIDSFYEYALKYAILFNDSDFMAVFNNLYHALKAHSFNGWAFRNIHYDRAHLLTSWIDSLASFFTSLMVLAGDIESAVHNHLTYLKIWLSYAGLPERWNFVLRNRKYPVDANESVVLEWYPLRPEFIESNWYLYQATRDPLFLEIGVLTMEDLQKYNRVPCGFAGTQDVRTGELSNRMESFFLSETVKYLYLLFDKEHMLNRAFSNYVFSTEAHPLWYDDEIIEYAGSNRFEELTEVGEFSENEKYDDGAADNITGPNQFQAIMQLTNPFALISNTLVKLIDRIIQSIEDLILPVQMVEYMDDSNQHSESERMLVAREAAAAGSAAKASVQVPRYYFDEQCEVVSPARLGHRPLHPQFYSAIASWESFYHLDAIYSFQSPAHLEGQARGLESRGFYNRYVDPESTCKAIKRTSTGQMRILDDTALDILISIPKGGRRGKVLWRHYSGEVETSSLNGMRIKLHKHQNRTLDDPPYHQRHGNNNNSSSGTATYEEGESYRVTMVNGIRVPDMLSVHDLASSYSRDLKLEVVDNGMVYIDGIIVENLRVTGRRRDKRK
jgi:hypothetical protein